MKPVVIHVLLCSLIFTFTQPTNGANILAVLTLASPSHHFWARHIFVELARLGHNVTVFAPDPDTSEPPNLHFIWAEKVYETIYPPGENVNEKYPSSPNPFNTIWEVWPAVLPMCDALLSSKGFEQIMAYPESYKVDLLIVDVSVGPCWGGFLHRFKYPPVMGLTAYEIPDFIYDFMDGHRQPAYIPHQTAEYETNMSFGERFTNFYVQVFEYLFFKHYIYSGIDEISKRRFNQSDLPHVEDLQNQVDMVLVNGHYSLEKHEPLPANVIPVAGLQIKDPKPFDETLQKFFATAKKGVVLFSLGTVVKSMFLKDAEKQMFIDAFSQFPDYHFIWKYEAEIEVPPNVLTSKWVKQNDILANPKTKAFISHGGLLGSHEAAWYGVPIIGLPSFLDQFRNVKQMVRAGVAVELSYGKLSVEKIKTALGEILTNPKYQKTARRRSELFRDQPEPPLSRAIFWIQWLIRHKDDTEAIKLPVKSLGWFKANSYDVILVSFLTLMAVTGMVWFAVWKLLKNGRGDTRKSYRKIE